eukprot:6205748-Pleurochrysis_carterae.AAC.5
MTEIPFCPHRMNTGRRSLRLSSKRQYSRQAVSNGRKDLRDDRVHGSEAWRLRTCIMACMPPPASSGWRAAPRRRRRRRKRRTLPPPPSRQPVCLLEPTRYVPKKPCACRFNSTYLSSSSYHRAETRAINQ